MTAGRPTEYKEEYCEKVVSIMSTGASIAEVAAELGICKQTFYNWTEAHPEFMDSYKLGVDKSEAWWNKLGRAGSAGQVKINPATWIFNMKNRFNWRDKTETEVRAGVTLNFDKQDEGL